MQTIDEHSGTDPLPIKDEENERPVPAAWRPVLRAIVASLVRSDYALAEVVPGVAPVAVTTAAQMRDYIAGYGENLVELPDASWESSICLWEGDRWKVMVDLWTAAEGRSDLVLEVDVVEKRNGHEFHVYMVYVP